MLVRFRVVLIILFLSSRFYRKRITLFSFSEYFFFSEAWRSSKRSLVVTWFLHNPLTPIIIWGLYFRIRIVTERAELVQTATCRRRSPSHSPTSTVASATVHSHCQTNTRPLDARETQSACPLRNAQGKGDLQRRQAAQSSRNSVSQNLSVFQRDLKTASPFPDISSQC